MNNFEINVEKYMNENHMLNNGDVIVIGVSGGADSMALFSVLLSIKEKYNLSLNVVHVNHGLREEAKEEAAYVQRFSEINNVPFILKEIDIKEIAKGLKLGTEEAGRKVRYEAFNSVIKEGPYKIAVAHNKNDRAETMLFNLFRGSGPKGLSSIVPVRENIIRPLLNVTRSEIEDYLFEKNIRFYIDKTNLENDYTRNKIRNILIPNAKEHVNDKAAEHIADAASKISLLNDFAEEEIIKAYKMSVISEESGSICCSINSLKELHPYILQGVIKRIIDVLVPGNRDISTVHIEDVIKLMDKAGNKEINLPYGLRARVSYDKLYIESETVKQNEEIRMETRILEDVRDFVITEKKYTKHFDYDKIKGSLKLRTMTDGDYLIINEAGNKKLLKDYLKDEKVPRELRNSIPILADDTHVLWVIGHRISEDVKITKDTRTIIEVFVNKEETDA